MYVVFTTFFIFLELFSNNSCCLNTGVNLYATLYLFFNRTTIEIMGFQTLYELLIGVEKVVA